MKLVFAYNTSAGMICQQTLTFLSKFDIHWKLVETIIDRFNTMHMHDCLQVCGSKHFMHINVFSIISNMLFLV